MTITAGDLRRRVTLQVPELTPDGGGGATLVWQNLGEFWAAIDPVGAGKKLSAGQVDLSLTLRVTVRYQAQLSTARRILFRGRAYTVTAVTNTGIRDRWLQFTVVEEVAS